MRDEEVAAIAREVRDELYHARALSREHRNRAITLARAHGDQCERIDGLIARLEGTSTTTPMEGSGDDNRNGNEKAVAQAG